MKISQSATQHKLIFAFILRFIDGLLGLYVNFALMLDTSGALNIMLNFAALHFLQGTLCYKQAKMNGTQTGKRKIINKQTEKKKQKKRMKSSIILLITFMLSINCFVMRYPERWTESNSILLGHKIVYDRSV